MEEWKNKRQKGIGGSDAAAIIGRSPYMTNQELWKIKTGRKQQEDISDKEFVKYGVKMEPVLIDMFRADNPQYEVFHEDYDVRYHKDYDFILGSLDGYVLDKETGKYGVLEIKTCNINKYNKDKWYNQIPDNYFCQILHYMNCTNYDFAIVYALLKHTTYIEIKKYEFRREEYQDQLDFLLNEEVKFWNNHILADIEPNLLINLE